VFTKYKHALNRAITRYDFKREMLCC